MSSENVRKAACVAGARSSKIEYLFRTRLDEMSVIVGSAVFLYLKTRERITSEWSLRMTGQDSEAFFDGMAKTLTMRKCGGRMEEMSPFCLAASKVGIRISL